MMIRNALVYTPDSKFEKKDIIIENRRIKALKNSTLCPEDSAGKNCFEETEIIDGSGCYAVPGLVDMHFHGCMGHDFCEGTPDAFKAIAAYQLSQGIMAICPATMTLPEETLRKICRNAADYAAQQKKNADGADPSHDGADLVGINLEGPFISMEKKGAQNPAYIRTADTDMFRRLFQASGGLVKTIAIAPETDHAMAFIDALKDETVISIAHTCADYDTAAEAIRRGAHHVTHLYNAMPGLQHRSPGVIGAAAEAESCHVELICDGVHIHPSTVRATFSMFGDDRIILISDSMEATGMADGNYSLGELPVTVHGNLATLTDGTIAGSATNLMDCVRTAVKKMNIPLESAVKCASLNPAKEIGIDGDYGSIAPGKYANIVLLDDQLNTRALIFKGKIVPHPLQ